MKKTAATKNTVRVCRENIKEDLSEIWRQIAQLFRHSARAAAIISPSRAQLLQGARRGEDMALGSASRISIASLSHNRRSLLAPTWGEVARSSVFRHNIVIGALA